MSELRITELSPVGSELFQDCESFLEELTYDELVHIEGGGSNTVISFHSNSIRVNSIGGNIGEIDIEGIDPEDLNNLKLNGYYGFGQTVNGRTIGNVVTVR